MHTQRPLLSPGQGGLQESARQYPRGTMFLSLMMWPPARGKIPVVGVTLWDVWERMRVPVGDAVGTCVIFLLD